MTDTIIHEPVQETITTTQWAQAKFRAVYDKAISALQDGYAGELAWKPLKNTRSLKANYLNKAHPSERTSQNTKA